jgi:hypothetical protein
MRARFLTAALSVAIGFNLGPAILRGGLDAARAVSTAAVPALLRPPAVQRINRIGMALLNARMKGQMRMIGGQVGVAVRHVRRIGCR